MSSEGGRKKFGVYPGKRNRKERGLVEEKEEEEKQCKP